MGPDFEEDDHELMEEILAQMEANDSDESDDSSAPPSPPPPSLYVVKSNRDGAKYCSLVPPVKHEDKKKA